MRIRFQIFSVGISTPPCLTPLLTENASDVAPLKLTVLCVSGILERIQSP